MHFIESPIFAKYRHELLDEESFRQLQNAITNGTTRIDREPGTGGLLKTRWGTDGKGKRSGVRVIFYIITSKNTCLLLHIYPKSRMDQLTPDQKRMLRSLVERELKALGE